MYCFLLQRSKIKSKWRRLQVWSKNLIFCKGHGFWVSKALCVFFSLHAGGCAGVSPFWFPCLAATHVGMLAPNINWMVVYVWGWLPVASNWSSMWYSTVDSKAKPGLGFKVRDWFTRRETIRSRSADRQRCWPMYFNGNVEPDVEYFRIDVSNRMPRRTWMPAITSISYSSPLINEAVP